jgi:hypothetical protein
MTVSRRIALVVRSRLIAAAAFGKRSARWARN